MKKSLLYSLNEKQDKAFNEFVNAIEDTLKEFGPDGCKFPNYKPTLNLQASDIDVEIEAAKYDNGHVMCLANGRWYPSSFNITEETSYVSPTLFVHMMSLEDLLED